MTTKELSIMPRNGVLLPAEKFINKDSYKNCIILENYFGGEKHVQEVFSSELNSDENRYDIFTTTIS